MTMKEPLLSDEIEKNPDFGFKDYSTLLTTIIRDPNLQTPFTIAIYGKWGSGKTTLMDAINEKLEKSCKELEIGDQKLVGVKSIWFSAWEFEKLQTPLWAIFLNRIIMEIQEMLPNEERKNKIIALAKGLLVLSSDLLLQKTIGIKTEDLEQIRDKVWKDIEKISSLREKLQQYVNEALKKDSKEKGQPVIERFVIFVDDLDRCLPEESIHIFESIKLFLNCKKCVFVIGIDREQIMRIFQKKFELKEENRSVSYVEKFIQLEFDLPPKTSDEIEAFILNKVPGNLKSETKLIRSISKFIEPNPRKIKRWLNSILFLEKLFMIKKKEMTKVDGRAPKIDIALASIWLFLKAHFTNFSNLIASKNELLNQAILLAKDKKTEQKVIGNFELNERLVNFLAELKSSYDETQLKDIIHLSKLTPISKLTANVPFEEYSRTEKLFRRVKLQISELSSKLQVLRTVASDKANSLAIEAIILNVDKISFSVVDYEKEFNALQRQFEQGKINQESYDQRSMVIDSKLGLVQRDLIMRKDELEKIEKGI